MRNIKTEIVYGWKHIKHHPTVVNRHPNRIATIGFGLHWFPADVRYILRYVKYA